MKTHDLTALLEKAVSKSAREHASATKPIVSFSAISAAIAGGVQLWCREVPSADPMLVACAFTILGATGWVCYADLKGPRQLIGSWIVVALTLLPCARGQTHFFMDMKEGRAEAVEVPKHINNSSSLSRNVTGSSLTTMAIADALSSSYYTNNVSTNLPPRRIPGRW